MRLSIPNYIMSDKTDKPKDEKQAPPNAGAIVQDFLEKNKIELRVMPRWIPQGQTYALGMNILADFIKEDADKPAS